MTLKAFVEQFIWKNDIINTIESTLDLEERLWGCSREEMHQNALVQTHKHCWLQILEVHWIKDPFKLLISLKTIMHYTVVICEVG